MEEKPRRYVCGMCIVLLFYVTGLGVYVLIQNQNYSDQLQSLTLDLQCMQCCRGDKECMQHSDCPKRLSSLSPPDLSFCKSAPIFSRSKIVAAVEEQLLLKSKATNAFIDKVEQELNGSSHEEYYVSFSENTFTPFLHSAVKRPCVHLVPATSQRTIRSESNVHNFRWKCKFANELGSCNRTTTNLRITKSGKYSIQVQATFDTHNNERATNAEDSEVSLTLKRKRFNNQKGHQFMREAEKCNRGSCTIDGMGVFDLDKEDELYVTFHSPKRFHISKLGYDTYFSVFLLSASAF